MEARLVVFLTFVSATMIVNAAFLFFTYKVFSALASRAAKRMSDLETSSQTRKWLTTLEVNSAEAARVTGIVRDRLAGFSESMEGILAAYGKSLAKTEARFSLVFRAMHFTAATMDRVVKFPVKNILLMSSVVRGVIAFIRGSENGADARSRRNR
jgi:hypothetical protein